MTNLARSLFAAVLILPAGSALAESQPDNATILKAIQALGRRLDRLEKQQPPGSAASTTPAALPVPAAPAPATIVHGSPTKVAVPGWDVEVLAAEDDKKDPVAQFTWTGATLNFGLHSKLVAGHNPYIYKGVARFHPDEKARYVFQLTLEPLRTGNGNGYACDGKMTLNDELLFQGSMDGSYGSGDWDRNNEIFSTKSFSGGAELEPSDDIKKDYVLTFQVSCWWDGRDHAHLPENAFKGWSDNRFSVLVKGPDDAAPRAFASDELYHSGRVRVAR